jgi:hypothetical protein
MWAIAEWSITKLFFVFFFFVLIRNSDPGQYIIVGSYEEYISAILWLTDLMVEETQNRYNKLNGETPNYE